MNSSPARTPRSATGLLVSLVVGLSIAAVLLLQAAAQDNRSTTFDDVVEEIGGWIELEQHAGFGNIVVGEVLAVLREDAERWSPQDVPNAVIYYRVAVLEALRGDAKGEVSIKYSGADTMSPDTRTFGPLEVGKRYLFSAGSLTSDGSYPVYAGMGTIQVPNDEVQAQLVKEFSSDLIPTAIAEEREAIEAATAAAERQRKR
ncbi:MAG: hypothetical protein IT338_01345 [Thermomicrobiales bacterium]|nr:hypothetical protein [Thermomicrobiales bacterium]